MLTQDFLGFSTIKKKKKKKKKTLSVLTHSKIPHSSFFVRRHFYKRTNE